MKYDEISREIVLVIPLKTTVEDIGSRKITITLGAETEIGRLYKEYDIELEITDQEEESAVAAVGIQPKEEKEDTSKQDKPAEEEEEVEEREPFVFMQFKKPIPGLPGLVVPPISAAQAELVNTPVDEIPED